MARSRVELFEQIRRDRRIEKLSIREMAKHDQIAEHFRDGVFFAHLGSPWERGSNENMNGLLRQYFPKGCDLSVYSKADRHESCFFAA
jgi:IS30 family transposase